MKILFITSRLPWPLDKGDRLRAYHQMRMLSLEHEVFLFSLTETDPSNEAIQALGKVTTGFQWHKMNGLKRWLRLSLAAFSSRPFQTHWFYQRKADQHLHNWMNSLEPEVIHCQLIRMAEYVRNDHQIPRVIDYMDALSAGMKRRANLRPFWSKWLFLWEAQRLARYESIIFDYFDGQTIISAADRKLISHPARKSIAVVPNGVDAEYFKAKRSPSNEITSLAQESPGDFVLLFTGNMSYAPNVDAAKRLVQAVLPKVTTPGVRVLIAGTKPTAEVLKLAGENVEVTGWVPDLRTAYDEADIFVAPLRIGTGQQNKILEAMSMGLPCITTTHVMNGLPKETHENPPLQLAEDDAGTARAIDELLNNKQKLSAVGEESRTWIEKNSSWEAQTHALELSFVNSTIYKPEEATWRIKK